VPIGMLLFNAENTFKKAQVKQISSKRRERLDSEHGVDRDKMTENFEKLDELYRVSEKKEIEKFNRIGKTTREYYERKQMEDELEKQKKEDKNASSELSSAELMK
jgi:hypothetical protein